MDNYVNIVNTIIKQQTSVIGPIALSQAKAISGIQISENGSIVIQGEPKPIIEHLVKQYEKLFGQASIEVCKDAVREMKPPIEADQLPDILK